MDNFELVLILSIIHAELKDLVKKAKNCCKNCQEVKRENLNGFVILNLW